MEINIIDGVVILILIFFAIRSFMRGIIQEILNLTSLVVALYLTMYTYDYFTPFYDPYIKSKTLVVGAGVVTALVVYLVVFYIVSFVINRILSFYALTNQITRCKNDVVINRILSFSALTPINQTLGLIFGIGKGLLVLSVVYMVLASIVQDRMPMPKIITDAQTEPLIRNLSNGLAQTFLPKLKTQVIDSVQNFYHNVLRIFYTSKRLGH